MSVATNTIPVDNQHSPDVSLKVHAAQIHHTYSQMVIGAITNPIAALGVVMVLSSVIPQWRLFIWFGMLVLLQSIRFVIAFRYRSITPTGGDALFWGRIQILINALSGMVWGVTFFALWPAGLPQYQLVLPVIVIGLGAGATAGYAPLRASHVLFILFSMVPLVIRFLAEGTTVYVTIGPACNHVHPDTVSDWA